ncbi:MAG TPA: proline dehydrogenase family protein [Bryobacteraceae bacterium]|jgi:proline dehydrogenase|nr:proline dehydrogenase family protein [Bryobacteraceae bacterium]
MMRQLFLFLSTQKGMRKWMETSPAAKKLTRRFIAGETLEDELAVCARLSANKTFSTLDHLGENVTSIKEAEASRDAYLTALDEISQRKLPSTVSIKLTQFGLDLSPEACYRNVQTLSARASETGTIVEIDMESSEYTDRTLAIVEKIGTARAVIQAYLYRSAADIEHLNSLKIPVRLCKGAYNEPESAAFPAKRDVDQNYLKLMKLLLDKGTYPAIASHDETILGEAFRYARERKIPPEHFEFQMLYGIRNDLQQRIIDLGYRLRVYVPYGVAWYPYFMRRLAERPANALFLAKNVFKG